MKKALLLVIGIVAVCFLIANADYLASFLATLKTGALVPLVVACVLMLARHLVQAASYDAAFEAVGHKTGFWHNVVLIFSLVFINTFCLFSGATGVAFIIDDAHRTGADAGTSTSGAILSQIGYFAAILVISVIGFLTMLLSGSMNTLFLVGGLALAAVLAALLLRSTVFQGEAVPFVMELPNYRLPGLKNVAQLLWEKARDFLQKAFTVIFAATIVIWFLQNFDLQLRLTADPQASILARIAGDIAPLFGPLGFADWRISTALITGFMAKESVVSSLLILFGSEAALSAALTPAQAAPLLVFCLLYTPCIAAVASVKRELGNKWAVIMVVNQCAVAWLCALLVRLAAVVLF